MIPNPPSGMVSPGHLARVHPDTLKLCGGGQIIPSGLDAGKELPPLHAQGREWGGSGSPHSAGENWTGLPPLGGWRVEGVGPCLTP